MSLRIHGVADQPTRVSKDPGFVLWRLFTTSYQERRVRGPYIELPALPAGRYHCEFYFEFGDTIEFVPATLLIHAVVR